MHSQYDNHSEIIFVYVCVSPYRQITIQVCRIIEELYTQYVAKAASELASVGGDVIICIHVHSLYPFCAGISRDGVFSVSANLSRLRAQLTVQANKRLIIILC